MPCRTQPSDHELIQIVDAALADSARRSGEWLVCRPGCAQCCVGVFAINQLDATRLRQGLADLEKQEKERAAMVRARARHSWSRLAPDFPEDSVSGILSDSEKSKLYFSNFANDEPCPALDPLSQTCDLYEARPLTCRVFGPPVRSEDGLGTCELCFRGATKSEIAECEMAVDPDDIESDLLQQAEHDSGVTGETIVAFCLAT